MKPGAVMLLSCKAAFSRALKVATLLPLLSAWVASGQATSGSISARVTDPAGSVVQGAQVSVQNLDNGVITTAVTNASGEFTLPALPPNNYKVVVEKTGFANAIVPPFKLDIDQRAHFNLKLKIQTAAQDVTVTDAAPSLQTQGAETGQVIGSREISDLPTLGRDFSSLLLLVPGVVPGESGANNLSISINGQREFGNSFQINGVEVSGLNNDTNVRPSPDAIQEFKVVTSTYAPEFGRASAGAVIIQTKAGTNNIHGTGIFLYRPAGTAANNNFAPKGSTPTINQKNYGVTIGGPLKKDKAFLFLAYEGFRNRNSYSQVGQTLVGQNQVIYKANGDVDLSGLKDPYTGKQVPIFDPFFFANNYYTQQFPNNVIPAAEVDPGGRNIVQKLFPAPQSANPYANYAETVYLGQNNNVANLRADYTFSQNNRFYLTYDAQQGDTSTSDPYAGGIPINGGGGNDTGDLTAYENHSIALTYDHVFTPTLLNEARATYFLSPVTQKSLVDGTQLAAQFGIQNANISGFPDTYGFPQIYVGSGPITGGSSYKPLTAREKIAGAIDSLTYTRGQHNAKLGYEFRHINSISDYSLFPVPFEYFAGPGSNFSSDPYYSFYDPKAFYYNGGSEIADILLGLPQVVYQGLQLVKPQTTANEHTFYLQDYWQIAPRLNITYGVRYEYLQPFVESNNNQSNFDTSTLQINIAGRGANSRSLANSNTTDLMPRVGVAYQLRPTTVLRGGYGLFFSPENDSRDIILTENYPFYTEAQYTNDAYNLNYLLSKGVPRATTVSLASGVSSIDFTKVNGAAVQTVNSEPVDFPTARSQSYNITLQQELDHSTSFEIGYVGANTRDLSYKVGDYNVNGRLSTKIGHVQTLLPVGVSNYDSLQAKVTRRFTRGYSALLSYTWAHNLDNGPAPRNLGRGGDYPQNPFNVNAEYSNADDDVRHVFVGSQVIELPFGKGKRFLSNANGITQALLGGWQLNSITTLRSGRPFNIQSNPGNSAYPGLRPNLTGNPYVTHRSKSQWFNPAAFTVPSTQAASTGAGKTLIVGTTPRNFLYGPGFTNEDVSLFKSFRIHKEMALQVRVEAFNVLNTSRYGQPDTNATHKGTAQNPGTFGQITGGAAGENQRVMQFAGRFTF